MMTALDSRVRFADRPDWSAKRTLHRGAWTLVLTLITCGQVIGSEYGCPEPDGCQNFLQRMSPAGGWHPDAGGLWHWWNPCCFPRCGGPDDYCRKPPPKVCWPPYPPYYVVVPPNR